MESLELCTHWVMESFVAIHYTAKAFYVLEFSIWGLGQSPNPRIESRQRFTDLLIPLSGLVVGRHSRYETALESKIVTRPLFHTPKAPLRVFWTDRSRKGRQISTHFVK